MIGFLVVSLRPNRGFPVFETDPYKLAPVNSPEGGSWLAGRLSRVARGKTGALADRSQLFPCWGTLPPWNLTEGWGDGRPFSC